MIRLNLCVLLALLGPFASAALSEADLELPTSQLLARGDALIGSGRAADALELYDVVVDRTPDDYLSRYKRATARSALGNSRKALEDLESVLKITDFAQARLQAAKLYLKLGEFDQATKTLKTYLKTQKHDPSGPELSHIAEASAQSAAAQKASSKKQWDACITAATVAIDRSPHSSALRELRSDCHLHAGPDHLDSGLADLSRAVALNPSSQSLLLKQSILAYLYAGHDISSALSGVKQCLHFDPEAKPCKSLFRALKAIEKDMAKVRNFVDGSSWPAAASILDKSEGGLVQRIRDALNTYEAEAGVGGDAAVPSRLLTTVLEWACKSLVRAKSINRAQPYCNELLRRDPTNVDGLVGRAEDSLKREEYDEAVRLLSDAFEKSGRSDQDILSRLQRAQKLLKQSKAKDYYKVLGVSRDADEKTIKRAYRKATIKAHPDKPGGSEAKMASLNEAYEVLSNPELRARFDNGDDPNDPTSGHGPQQGHPFFAQGGGMPFVFQQGGGGSFFQQGGQQFHFKFG